MKSLTAILVVVGILFGGVSSVLAVNPDIGGSAIHTEEDYFSFGDWGLTVYSYVYDSTSATLPVLGISLDPGEMLFAYMLDGDNSTIDSVEYFSVYNTDNMPIIDVGWDGTIVPAGYAGGDYQDPGNFQYSGFTLTTSYNFTGGYMFSIQPDEWSLVYYVAIADEWALNVGTVAAGGADEQFVPTPTVPEPTTICMLGLGALALLRKRRRMA